MAEHGIASVPLREIGIAAGQKNNVAVQYHFGDRDGLVRAIIQHRASTSEEQRVEMVADLLGQGHEPAVSDLVRAFVFPLAAHLQKGNRYLAFLSRYIIERGGYAGLDHAIPPSTVITLRSALLRLLAEHPAELLEERWMIMQTCAVHTLARYQAAAAALRQPPPDMAALEDLVAFLSGGIEAPYGRTPKG
jgi:AcrR family transcriptional regulator